MSSSSLDPGLEIHPSSAATSLVDDNAENLKHALGMAVSDGDIDRVMDLISMASRTRTALRIPEAVVQLAIEQENLGIVDQIIDSGASCSGLNLQFEQTAIHAALFTPFPQDCYIKS
jgi:hypothetical protein